MPTAMVAVTLATLSFFAVTSAKPAQQQSAAASAMSLAEDAVHRFSNEARLVDKQEPGGIIGPYITDTLFPLALEAKKRIEDEVQASVQKVQDCGNLMWSAEKEVEHREEILQSDEGEKYECLAIEHKLHHAEKEACDGWHNLLRSFAGEAKYVLPGNESEDRNANYLQTYFSESRMIEMEKTTADIEAKKEACDKATREVEEQHNTCVVDEETIEKFYCSMKYQRDQACAAYSTCYDQGAAEVEKTEIKMKELEAQEKEDYRKLACFQDGVGNLEMDPARCDQQMFDTTHLDVDYPGVPPAEECVHLMKMRRDYSKITCSGGAVVFTTTPAPPPAPAQTPAKNSTEDSPVAPPTATNSTSQS